MGIAIYELEAILSEFPDGRELHLVIDGEDYGEDYDIEISCDDVEPIIRIETR